MKKFSIGIDLGGTKILIALVDKTTGEVICHVKKKTKKDKGPKNIIRKMVDGINELMDESSVNIDDIESIGIGAAGQVDRENGILIGAPNLDCYDLNIREHLLSQFNWVTMLKSQQWAK